MVVVVIVSVAGSGVCEPTNQKMLVVLKRQELKQRTELLTNYQVTVCFLLFFDPFAKINSSAVGQRLTF